MLAVKYNSEETMANKYHSNARFFLSVYGSNFFKAKKATVSEKRNIQSVSNLMKLFQ